MEAFARVYVGTHYPGDVLAGVLIGITVALALFLLPPTRRLIESIAERAGRVWDSRADLTAWRRS